MRVYYNEIDPHCCEWLQNLMDLGAISKGVIDNRSILDVTPSDLRGFTRCHFFSGVGVWDYALRLAGVSDDRPVWTGSCPCQPFSAAGKGGGFADERHLWPAFDWLIAQRRPDVVFGEQVEGPAGRAWLDLVSTDLEGSGYAFGTTVFPSAGVGAPHGRHRTYWCAESLAGSSRQRRCVDSGSSRRGQSAVDGRCETDRMADDDDERLEGRIRTAERGTQRAAGPGSVACELADAADAGRERRRSGETSDERSATRIEPERLRDAVAQRPGPYDTPWGACDWLLCRDGKWRPVEPETQPLVDGSAFRMGSGGPFEGKHRAKMLAGYGNAINPHQAAEFIRAYLDTETP